MMMMAKEEEYNNEEGMSGDDSTIFWKCWKTFLPSTTPKFVDLTDAPKKSVRFRLDQNTVHSLPELSKEDDYPIIYISEQEQEETRLDMNETVEYFRHVFLLESRPKNSTTPRMIGDVSTIGLEWRIWPDGRFERRQEIHRVVLANFLCGTTTSLLARHCEPISKVSEQLARKRAIRVVRDLLKDSNKPQDISHAITRKYDLGRWMGIHSWMKNIPLLRQE